MKILDENEECKFTFAAQHEFYENKFDERVYLNFFSLEQTGPLDDFLKISHVFCITGTCFMFDMDLKKICGDYEEYPGEDYVMGVKMGSMTRVYACPESLGAHCLHPDSLTIKSPGCVHKADGQARRFIERINKL